MRVVSIRYAALSLLIAMFALAAMSASAWAGKRVALIIGNSAYEHAPELANPRNDAADFAAKLAELEFEVIVRQDAKLSEMLSAVEEFSDKLHNAELSLFYYAGHGLQVDGRNYLVPVGAKLESHITLDYEAVPVDLVMATMQSRSKTNLLFLDACRNNPLRAALPARWARVPPPSGEAWQGSAPAQEHSSLSQRNPAMSLWTAKGTTAPIPKRSYVISALPAKAWPRPWCSYARTSSKARAANRFRGNIHR